MQNPPETILTIPPIRLGDETVARIGSGPSLGSSELAWQHGRVLFDITAAGNPSVDPLNAMAALAQKIDALYTQHPVGG